MVCGGGKKDERYLCIQGEQNDGDNVSGEEN